MVFRTLAALSAVAAVASAEYYEGDGTSYTLGDVSDGNCNFMSAIPTASTNYAALNNDQWDDLANCGRCAEVSCIDDQCTDQSTTAIVQILDRCPECSSGDLDLSPTVFSNITGSDPSRLSIRWQFVDCPSPGTIEVCLKTGSNGYYVAVQPTNTLVGVESVTINGETTTMVDSAYYYLIESTSEVDLTSVIVSITSIEGETVEGTYSLTAGACVDTNQQFTTSSSSQTSSSQTSTSTSTTTSAPTSTTATPTSTTATPTSTEATQTQGSSAAEEADSSYTEDVATTTAPTSTTATPTSTTSTPVSTTSTPVSTTSAPVSTTAAPSATTATPAATTASPKCRVRSRRD
jgi:expansin (peptidoglycan-binding protein)